nr:hypothetical protein [Nostoc sp. EkiNYC01]
MVFLRRSTYPFLASGHHKGRRSLKNAGFAALRTLRYQFLDCNTQRRVISPALSEN